MTYHPRLLAFAAANGAVAVALGAFAAHGADPAAKALLTTGAQYQMVHAALACLCATGAAALKGASLAGWLASFGGLIFSTALALIALAGLRFMGAVAPIGGTLMILGWIVLILAAFRSDRITS